MTPTAPGIDKSVKHPTMCISKLVELCERDERYRRALERLYGCLEGWRCNDAERFATVASDEMSLAIYKGLSIGYQTLFFDRERKRSRIRELYASQMFPSLERCQIPVGVINQETGHVNHVDMLYVAAIAQHQRAKRIFEIGTYLGRTTLHLTYASESPQVFTLNLPPAEDETYGPYIGTYFKGTDREKFITQLFSNSHQFDPTAYRRSMDFVFVDGDHSYAGIANDTEKAMELLAPGGVVVWHDYAGKVPDVCRFFADYTKQRPVFRIRDTCLIVHIDGVDPMSFEPHPMRDSFLQAARRKAA